MLLDANILLYAVDTRSGHHTVAASWLESALNGQRRLGIPWQTIGAFLRISTHPRVTEKPLTPAAAGKYVETWLGCYPVWVPPATERTYAVYEELAHRHRVTGNLVPDAMLAALARENGVPVVSADGDFARFAEIRWINPLAQ
jgi:uncharacterized protein